MEVTRSEKPREKSWLDACHAPSLSWPTVLQPPDPSEYSTLLTGTRELRIQTRKNQVLDHCRPSKVYWIGAAVGQLTNCHVSLRFEAPLRAASTSGLTSMSLGPVS